jgi:3-oxoacyl-[acyl-carrier protein] reductase
MDLDLTGKRALVTGSTSGIGRGIATALAGEGATVIVHGRNPERAGETAALIRDAGGTAHIAMGDLATDEGAAAVADAVAQATGGIDILVNNIGGTESYGGQMLSWFEVGTAEWLGTLQQNLLSAVRMIRAFVPAMRDCGWGRVINISSGGGAEPPVSVPDYCAAKAGLNNLTVSLSKELSRSGVTVNTVSPGCTRTDMFERNLERMAEANGWPDDMDEREKLFMDLRIFACTSERYGRPGDIGALVAFLASPLSAFVNGANYRIDGGQVQSVN